jgi:hypothetical protein
MHRGSSSHERLQRAMPDILEHEYAKCGAEMRIAAGARNLIDELPNRDRFPMSNFRQGRPETCFEADDGRPSSDFERPLDDSHLRGSGPGADIMADHTRRLTPIRGATLILINTTIPLRLFLLP